MAHPEPDRPAAGEAERPSPQPAEPTAAVPAPAEAPLPVAAVAAPPAKPAPAKPAAPAKPGGKGGEVRPFPGPKGRPGQRLSDSEYRRMMARARAPARRLALASFALLVILPTILTGLYYAFVASDQYAVTIKFAVRGNDSAVSDIGGMLLGATGSSASTGDSYIVQEFIGSREMVERLEQRTDLVEKFTGGDLLSRAGAEDPMEDFLDYWRSMVTAEYDSYSSIISVEVKAFAPEDAREIATLIMEESTGLVNRLSEQARQDTLALAQREVAFAEDRLREARAAVATFSGSVSTVDFAATAAAQQETIARLESELVGARAELEQMTTLVSADSPSVRVIRTRIAALEKQLADQRMQITGTGEPGSGTTANLERYRELQTESEFAEKAYVSSLAALDIARAESKKTHRYLATFVGPILPTSAEYPLRVLNTFVVLIVCAVGWAIGALVLAAVRDHSA